MPTKNIFLIVAAAFILLAGFLVVRNNPTQQSAESDFSALSDIELLTMDGEAVKLGDYGGRPLVLNSWAVWCPFCKKEISEFAEIQAKEPNVTFIVINRSESVAKNEEFISENNLSDKILFLRDPKDKFYNAIGGFSMPETLFFNAEGKLIEHKRGPLDAKQTQDRVDKIK